MQSKFVRGGLLAAVSVVALTFVSVQIARAQGAARLTAGAELAAKGAWNATTTYAKDDIVTARGSAWISRKAGNKNKVPGQTGAQTTAIWWQLFARGSNPTGAWLNSTTYQPDDLVTFNGQTWRAKTTQSNRQPAANQFWELLVAKGANGTNGTNGANGADGGTGPQGPAGPNTGIGLGSQSEPSISFNNDAGTGIYSPVAGKIAMVANSSLFLHNKGTGTVALGLDALKEDSIGDNNTAIGDSALKFNAAGVSNTAVGASALMNTISSNNTGVGYLALQANTIGHTNTAVGDSTLKVNSGGAYNTAVGGFALTANTNGNFNTAVGRLALSALISGQNNTAVGASALQNNTGGGSNTALGDSALFHNTGSDNTALGLSALAFITTGSGNIAVGRNAGLTAANPTNSIFIGNNGVTGDTTTIKIGKQGTQTSTFIAGIHGATSTGGIGVFINSDGQLGTATSSRRYKDDIQPVTDAGSLLAKLRPVTFHYKQSDADGAKPKQYGLIAEEVEQVAPDLAAYNKDGSIETVKYHFLPPLLLAGYQAQQKTIDSQAARDEEQQRTIAAQADEIAVLKREIAEIRAMLPHVTKAAAVH